MSKKNETTVLLLSLAITLGLVAGGVWLFMSKTSTHIPPDSPTSTAPPVSQPSRETSLSVGEKLLIPGEKTLEKQAAVEAFAAGNYKQAVDELEASLKAKRNDPEALIYLNNARIGNAKSYTIAASMPIGVEVNAAKEMLRGVAQGQNEINAAGGINGVPLKVLIANDDNDPEVAKKVAQAFVNNPDVLGVVGHFGSNVTLAGAEVYQKSGLVVISPTSTSVALSGVGKYVFRTVPSDRFAGSALSRYMLRELNKQKAAVFFNSASNYSTSLKNVFTTDLFAEGGEVVSEFDFASSDFNVGYAVQQAREQGAEVLMLAPNSATLDQALQVIQVNDGRLPMLAGDSAYKPKTLQIGGGDALGMVLAVPWHILGDPDSEFPKAATRLWGGDVNWRTALAYDATRVLIAALKRSATRSGVQQALSAPDFSASGASGKIRFLPSGDRNQAVQLVKIEPGSRSGFGYDFVPVP
ncbi:MAG: ABC transporter substrate-binding protein [Xenococcaceae cyanobacterium]